MSDISNTIMKLQLGENIFNEIKFFVSGEVNEKIVELLKCGGAERLNYFSDYVTHLIVGENPEENDIADANDVYEIPALTPKWVLMSAALKRQVHIKPYLYFPGGKLFSNLVFCFSSIREDLNVLWSLITYNGGIVQLNLNRKCDYLVTTNSVGPKYEKAESLGSDLIKIVTPDWIVEAVKNNSYPDFTLFHPKLINWPKPFKHESTTAITGFEPEQLISEEHHEEKIISDSTQALLEKLKQRMPWNQPSAPLITPSSDPIAPPNVVAPSFKTAHLPNPVPKVQPQQTVPQPQSQTQVAPQSPVSSNLPLVPRSLSTTLTNQQVPKGIIHHTPTPTSNFQQQHNQHNPLNISRLIGQPQTRSNLQLRGQTGQTQLHQQLLHQQNQTNIIQRTSGQIPIPQQILQQQLQRQLAQRHILQNQNQLLQQQQGNTNQQQIIQDQQHIGPNQHIAQLSKQQLNQLQQQQLQLKQNQQLQITQNQQLSLNQGHHQIQIGQSQQQVPVTQNQQQVQMNPNPQQIQVSQSQQQIQISQSQQQIEVSQNQQQMQSNQNQQQMQSNQNQQQIQSNQNQQQIQSNQIQQNQNQQQIQLNQNQPPIQLNPNQQIQLNQNQQQIQLNQNQQQIQLNQNQQQLQINQNQQQIQINQNQQTQNQQQIQLSSNQQHIQLNSKQQQIQLNSNQQQIQLNSNQQQIQLNSNQQQVQLNQNQQQIQLNQNQQLQLNQNQHIQQAQSQIQLNQSQHIQLNKNQVQNQQQLLQNQVMQPPNQQNQINQQGSQQIQISQGQNFIQQTMNQLISQQNQQILQQKQQFLSQQQAATSQQQTLHNQPNLAVQQQQFVSSSFSQNQDLNQRNISQQGLNQVINQQNMNHQNLNVQVLNQQLSTQNLGQQLNQQQLNQQQLNQQQLNQQINPQVQHNQLGQQISQQEQLDQRLGQQNQLNQQQIGQQAQLNQQSQINQQLTQQNQLNQQIVHQSQLNQQNQFNQQQINQQNQLNDQTLEQGLGQTMQVLNQQLNQGINQQLQQQLNRQTIQQQQQQMTQQQLQQQGLNQQNLQQQLNQVNSSLPQQVVRSQFQQQPNIGQQILINQASPQNSSPQRTQLNQHLWAPSASQVPAQQIIRHPVNIIQQGSPRVQWSPNAQQGAAVTQRQFIQLDARTHQELQKMPPEQQALFIAKLQRHRQFLKQVQQRGGGGSHILIRGNVPPGLTPQQQVQWLQQQAKQQGIVLPPNIQQQTITPGTLTQPGLTQSIQHAPGLSPINQSPTQFTDQNLQIRQFRLQQLQLQREQAQKNHLAQQQGTIQQPTVVRPVGQSQLADSTTNTTQLQDANIQHSLVVNAKTKTALANMLSIKLQSGGSSVGGPRPETIQEPSAAGTLRLMTAQHNAALNSKPQEIIALQRRTINGPNGEIIKPPGAQQLPTTPTNEPPKLQYCPKPSLPLQHRPGPFYGHNPNLKLPPDLFLLGCIFVVVEVDSFLEESMPGWQKKIEKHGGEVEKQYCNRVTHVLCETQRHGVVMQALRDCKRCVTIYWLNDVLHRKQVLPPWTALHLPNIYLDTAPAAKHLMSFCGFEGNDRNRIKQMIKNTGANFTSYFSKHNTVLIASKGDCKKCAYAKKWQIPVVNVQWLTDVMLGHFSAMNQMEHQIYQQFSNPSNFSFDPKLVPNLMVAWKAPINISQESYERVKRSASPVVLPKKPKVPKVEPTDENDNVSEEHYRNSTHKIIFSMFPDTKQMEKMVRDLGGVIAKNEQDFTHLIMPTLARSHKLFYAIVRGCKVVSDRWLKDSHGTNQFLPENDYNLDSKEFNYEFNCNIDQTFLKRNRNKLFEGKFFFITPSVFPCKRVVVELVQCCGGIVERRRRSSAQIEATSINSPYSYFIVTHENDLHLVGDLLKNKKDKMKIVCNAELIFSAILKQTFEVEPYAVCVL